jgi:hypothetical protein
VTDKANERKTTTGKRKCYKKTTGNKGIQERVREAEIRSQKTFLKFWVKKKNATDI